MPRHLVSRLISLIALAVLAAGSTTIEASAQSKIVSVGGDVTEILYGIGADDQVVATDTTSVYPTAAALTPKVGYVRRLSAEGVLSLEPDLILISGAAGPEAAAYDIYPKSLGEPYRSSRFKVGEDMYALLGIPREDKGARLMNLAKSCDHEKSGNF